MLPRAIRLSILPDAVPDFFTAIIFSTLVLSDEAGDIPFVMRMFHAEIVVEKDGKLYLDHVPFSEGETVHVFVSSATPLTEQSLKGSVLKYEQPLAPVAEGDWEAAK
jgi:hypothetical protein